MVQVPALLLVADFTQYWVHRTFHAVPFLWPFHAIHHSVEEMDWLAGSRLHLVDVIVTRGLTYMPIFVLGFSEPALMVYVFLVAAQATFIHANVRWEFRPLRQLVATPAFHHWHHSAEREAVDKNFAVHTPIWDILFGTYYLPDRWPIDVRPQRRTRCSGTLGDAIGLPISETLQEHVTRYSGESIVLGIDVGSTTVKAVVVDPATEEILWSEYQRHETRQAEKTLEMLARSATPFPTFRRTTSASSSPARAPARCASRSARSSCRR